MVPSRSGLVGQESLATLAGSLPLKPLVRRVQPPPEDRVRTPPLSALFEPAFERESEDRTECELDDCLDHAQTLPRPRVPSAGAPAPARFSHRNRGRVLALALALVDLALELRLAPAHRLVVAPAGELLGQILLLHPASVVVWIAIALARSYGS